MIVWLKHTSRLLLTLSLGFLLWGCDSDDDLDNDPPPGQGAILIDNNTFDDIRVFINGERLNDADDFDVSIYTLDPGVYRLVLDQIDGDRSFRDDIDILENRNTVLDVAIRSFLEYDILIYFD